MRKILFALFLILSAMPTAFAKNGDTTWVQANSVRLNDFNNFDTAVVFPAGGYRKIYMYFTLGKYVCPGSLQYCGDWDYTVQTFFMGQTSPDTVELGRFITPYAHTGFGRFSAGWTQRYIFDVTDYYPILRNSGAVRIHYSGYSGGFTANVRFAFIEGVPERHVTGIQRLWHGDFAYGHGAKPINTALGTIAGRPPSGTLSSELRMNITGHGGDNNGCAEFCPNIYTLNLNGSQLVQQPFFRSDCSANDLYPQSGTWIYARANWCPGALVNTITHALPGIGSSAYSVGLSFPAYTSGTNGSNSPASYTIDAATVYYGPPKKALDAGIEDIVAPSTAEYFYRENPASSRPKLLVRNSGGTAITSIKFQYGVSGRALRNYTWTGALPSFTTSQIELPVLDDLRLAPGNYGFAASIVQVNGSADEDVSNDTARSTFVAAPAFPAGLHVQLKSSMEGLPSNASIGQTAWRIEDMSGVVVKRRADCGVGAVCNDTVRLTPGMAYKLVVTDSGAFGYYDIPSGNGVAIVHGSGLSGFATPFGYIRIYDIVDGFPVSLPGAFGGNFGSGFTQYFYVGNPTTGVKNITTGSASLHVFPNPVRGAATVLVDGLSKPVGTITMLDITGRSVLRIAYTHGMERLDVSRLPPGSYVVEYTAEDASVKPLRQRLVIAE